METMDNNSGDPIACECQPNQSPVDFYGDVLCETSTPSKPNVREMIRMYEPPEGDNVSRTESIPFESRSKTSHASTATGSAPIHHMVIEEPSPKASMASTQEIQLGFLNSFSFRTEEVMGSSIGTIGSSIGTIGSPRDITPAPRKSLKSLKVSNKNDGKTYKSQTSITHTANGIRIITEIFPETILLESDIDWTGKKIETDIPKSRILSEFIEKTQ